MSDIQAFAPLQMGTVTVAVSTVSATTVIQAGSASRRMRIYNSGPSTVFVEYGSAAATVANSMPIPAGQTEVLSWGRQSALSMITAAATATVYVTPGEGI